MTRRILYSSFQTGSKLPGFVRYALASLSQTGFPTVLLTNNRVLDADSLRFLEHCRVELFLTENRGFDFGMWKRYLSGVPEEEFRTLKTLVLINDSMVYYQNRFAEFFRRSEESFASMVSLTENQEDGIPYHLQSFFLYLKPPAISELKEHLALTAEAENMTEAILNFEVALSQRMIRKNIPLGALFKTPKPVLFDYASLIENGAGFVKRRLIEKRFDSENIYHFLCHGESKALQTNYVRLIREKGNADPGFDFAWLSEITNKPLTAKVAGFLRFYAGYLLGKLRLCKANAVKTISK
ncbi:MAG: rhamnan synthesis F family protein [Fibrobacter sp.]|jgi:hypothetical protein|nr:rhamnan synthesis F family protein [Fibrobacter sp.]